MTCRSSPSLIFFAVLARMAKNAGRRRDNDAYYTPAALADAVVRAATVSPNSVLDPAVGDGSLLRAAVERWPSIRAIGLDIDSQQLRRTRIRNPDWDLGRVDIFSDRSRRASSLWRSAEADLDLILLNPPFSYRGGHSEATEYEGSRFNLTPASASVAVALSRLRPDGELLALLPAGVLSLERDDNFWRSVSESRAVDTVAEFSSTAFPGTRTKSVLVAVRAQAEPRRGELLAFPVRAHFCVELVRGRVPVHRVGSAAGSGVRAQFLHTRDLSSLPSVTSPVVTADGTLATPGPLLVLPRVGRVLASHLKIVASGEPVVLSDCVLALRAADAGMLIDLQRQLLEEVHQLQELYRGSCAPYVTLRRLSDFLAVRGFCVHHVAASAPPDLDRLSGQCKVPGRST